MPRFFFQMLLLLSFYRFFFSTVKLGTNRHFYYIMECYECLSMNTQNIILHRLHCKYIIIIFSSWLYLYVMYFFVRNLRCSKYISWPVILAKLQSRYVPVCGSPKCRVSSTFLHSVHYRELVCTRLSVYCRTRVYVVDEFHAMCTFD